MVFSSLTFLFVFLPIIISVYYISPRRIRNTILFIGSLVFYAWGEPIYITIMLFSTVFDYINGLFIKKYKETKQNKKAKIVLINSIVVNLGILCFFKYSNFLLDNVNNVFHLSLQLLNIALPIGISFYTFQTMSYHRCLLRKSRSTEEYYRLWMLCYIFSTISSRTNYQI